MPGPKPRSAAERLAAKLSNPTPRGCLEFTGYRTPKGYGRIGVGSRAAGTFYLAIAHRLAYELAHGPIPAGQVVMHKCDNPPCCNVEHLTLGSTVDNVRDCVRKGRRASTAGSAHGMSVLTEQDVRDIRAAYRAGGVSQSELGEQYGVTKHAIQRLIARKTWKHIE